MDLKKLILAILSFLFWPVGVILYFVYTPKKDAKLFGTLALVGIAINILYLIF